VTTYSIWQHHWIKKKRRKWICWLKLCCQRWTNINQGD